ncbi:CLUMA_CG021618, isoform A [Clunio marinus]|uniref:CLUMA_CG021618, isoform A n=1 Tax=Clunio marinus TaxID=568069 RepID=A0A1J1J8A9_9DIPT|nr:CLUMA_CG021618, isoform A [Clunio marinus]
MHQKLYRCAVRSLHILTSTRQFLSAALHYIKTLRNFICPTLFCTSVKGKRLQKPRDSNFGYSSIMNMTILVSFNFSVISDD